MGSIYPNGNFKSSLTCRSALMAFPSDKWAKGMEDYTYFWR